MSLIFVSIALIYNHIISAEIVESKENVIIKTGYKSVDIPAINSPRFTNVFLADNFLFDSEMGVHVNVDGVDKFYSNQILSWHHVVNEVIGDKFLIISRCPLCNSNSVFISENPLNSGLEVINNNNILWDNFGNKWRQIDGSALGDHDDLVQVSSIDVSWRYWKLNYRNGEVLTVNTGFNRNYNQPPFQGYSINENIFYPVNTSIVGGAAKREVIEYQINNKTNTIDIDKMINNIYFDVDNSILLVFIPNISSYKLFEIKTDIKELSFLIRNNLIIEVSSGAIFNPMLESQNDLGIQLNSLNYNSYYKMCSL